MATQVQGRDAMQFINEQDAPTLERFIKRLEFRAKDPTFTAYREAYLKLLDLPRAEAVLDIGCGTGVVTRAIAARDGFTEASVIARGTIPTREHTDDDPLDRRGYIRRVLRQGT